MVLFHQRILIILHKRIFNKDFNKWILFLLLPLLNGNTNPVNQKYQQPRMAMRKMKRNAQQKEKKTKKTKTVPIKTKSKIGLEMLKSNAKSLFKFKRRNEKKKRIWNASVALFTSDVIHFSSLSSFDSKC